MATSPMSLAAASLRRGAAPKRSASCSLSKSPTRENLWDTRAEELLRKPVDNPPQSEIKDPAARRANVLGVYELAAGAAVEGKHILLIDDILTTGATLEECTRMLTDAGAASVVCVTLAAARPRRDEKKETAQNT